MSLLRDLSGEMVIPDLIEPIIGWRAWYVGGGRDGLSLFSVIHEQQRWPVVCARGELRAPARGAG